MSKTKTKNIVVGVIMALVLFASIVPGGTAYGNGGGGGSAAPPWNSLLKRISGGTAGKTHIDSAGALVGVVQTYVFGIVLTITFITLILTGIKIGLARGDIKAFMEAKRALAYSIAAFILALGAFFFRRTLLNILGAPDLGPTRNIR